jgi:hypothetical protein
MSDRAARRGYGRPHDLMFPVLARPKAGVTGSLVASSAGNALSFNYGVATSEVSGGTR